MYRSDQATAMSKAQSDLASIVKRAAASTLLSCDVADSRHAEARSAVKSAKNSVRNLKQLDVGDADLRSSFTTAWVNAV